MTFLVTLHRRPHFFYPTCILALIIAWWVLWLFAATQYRTTLNGWIAEGRSAGYDISYDSESLFGFPGHVVLRFINLQWKNDDGIMFKAGDIDIGASLWQRHFFTAKFKGRAEILAPIEGTDHTLVLSGTNGTAEVDLDSHDYWKFSHIMIRQAEVGRKPDYVFQGDELNATAIRPENDPNDHHEAGLTLSGTADHVALPATVPRSFGTMMDRLELSLRVMGAVPDYRKRSSVDRWNKDSGVIEVDKMNVEWGPLQMVAKGTMGLDDDLQPEGAFASTLGNPQATIKALKEGGFIAARQEDMLQSAIDLFAKPAKEDKLKGMQVPIAVQLGGLFLGPVKILSYPQIEWPQDGK